MKFEDIAKRVNSEDPARLKDIQFVLDFLLNRLEYDGPPDEARLDLVQLDYADRAFSVDWPARILNVRQLDVNESEIIQEAFADHPHMLQGMSLDGRRVIVSPSSPGNTTGRSANVSTALFVLGVVTMKKEADGGLFRVH